MRTIQAALGVGASAALGVGGIQAAPGAPLVAA
jgi:hypothetical protein